jgi:hypothetical protein
LISIRPVLLLELLRALLELLVRLLQLFLLGLQQLLEARRVAVCASSSAFERLSSSCCACSSSDWLCRSWVSDCDWSSSSSVREFALIVFRTTPIDSESWSRNVCWTSVNGVNAASSITAITVSSNKTGEDDEARRGGLAEPDVILM